MANLLLLESAESNEPGVQPQGTFGTTHQYLRHHRWLTLLLFIVRLFDGT
jgi:hypothetical protein